MAELSAEAVMKAVEDWLASLMRSGDTHAVVQGLNDPETTLSQIGLSPSQASQVNWGQAYSNACAYPGVPSQYGTGSFGSSQPSMHEVIQQVRYVTEVNEHFDNHSQNVYTDNSLHVEGSTIEGDLTYDPQTANATGGSVAGTGGGAVTGATGDGATAVGPDGNLAAGGSTIVDGPNFGNVTTGDHNATVGGNTLLGFGTGEPGPVLTRELGGVEGLGGGQPININTGDGTQQVATVGGAGDHVVNFGAGADITQVDHSALTNSAVAGHDAQNIAGNALADGSAIGGHDAQGTFTDSHDQLTYTESHSIDTTAQNYAPDSVVEAGQADDGSHVDQHADGGQAGFPDLTHPA
jgi:hypothetical protein